MEVKDIEKFERAKGIASTVKAAELIQQYSGGVQKFLRDNQASMGDEWVESVGDKLYNFHGKNKDGDILGSSTDMGVAIATFTDIPLITGKQLIGLYNQAGKKNPFGNVYIDFGAMVNGTNINPVQAKILLGDFKKRGIETKGGLVPDFVQLRLVADKDAGLAYRLADSATDVTPVSEYPFCSTGSNGLFRACLNWNSDWYAYGDYLANSSDKGRVVRYDAEGVARVAPKPNKDLVCKLAQDFAKKF